MKKLILALLAAVSILVVVAYLLTSCDNRHQRTKVNYTDSLVTVKLIKQSIDPEFKTIEEVSSYRFDLEKKNAYDSIFTHIPLSVLRDVSNVCLNKYGKTSKEGIVQEYISNREIYDNLRKLNSHYETDVSLNEEPKTIEDLFEKLEQDKKEKSNIDSINNKTSWIILKNSERV